MTSPDAAESKPLPEYTGSANQGELFSSEIVGAAERLEALETNGRSTGERILAKNPKLYEAVLKLASLGFSGRAIAEVVNLNAATVQSIINSNPDSIKAFKGRMCKRWQSLADMSTERLEERVADPEAKISTGELYMLAGISTDKARELQAEIGEPDNGVAEERLEDVADAIAQLPVHKRPVGDIVEAELETDLHGGESGEKEQVEESE